MAAVETREITREVEFGSRFGSDSAIFSRVAHAATEGEVLADPMAWALDALLDCASADHWYMHEKQWD